jgi:hypothetical protein
VHRTNKPVRKCHSCLLNLGDRCWLYACPHDQWHGHAKCPGFGNEKRYADFREWQDRPKSEGSKDARRRFHREHRQTEEHYNHFGGGKQVRLGPQH